MLGYFVGRLKLNIRSQKYLKTHSVHRFSLSTGVNFNRDFLNLTELVYHRITAAIAATDSDPEDGTVVANSFIELILRII